VRTAVVCRRAGAHDTPQICLEELSLSDHDLKFFFSSTVARTRKSPNLGTISKSTNCGLYGSNETLQHFKVMSSKKTFLKSSIQLSAYYFVAIIRKCLRIQTTISSNKVARNFFRLFPNAEWNTLSRALWIFT